MKRKLLLFMVMTSLLICLFVVSISALEVTVGEVTYTVTQGATPEENTAVVNSHKSKTFTTTDITIPVSVQDENGTVYYVTGLHSEAFRSTNLTSVTFEAGSKVKEIGNYCFTGSNKLTTVVLPDSLKYIRGEAFKSCSVLTALYLPDTVESIGFYEDGSESVVSNSGPFIGCGKLFFVNELGETTKPTEWRAPTALREISGETFKERGSLSPTIIFGENLIYVGNAFAFSKMGTVNNARRTIIFEGDFTREGAHFAYSCESSNLDFHFTNPNITTVSFIKFHTDWVGVTINNTYAYVYGANKKAFLTNQATTDAEALEWMDFYRNITVVVNTPNGEKEICILDKDLFEISFKFEITGIKEFADPDDSSVTYTKSDIVKLHINATPSVILGNALADLSNLKEVILDEGASVDIYKNAFKNCSKLERLDMRQGSVIFKNEAFSGFTQLKELLLSSNNYRFDDASFKNSGITSLVIPDGTNIEYFGKAAFTGTKIKTLYIGNITGDLSIKDQRATFDGILTLETVVLMNINTLGEWALSIGDTVTPECDLTVYCHSADLTLHANAFNNRQNGDHKVFLYTLDSELNVTSFNKCNYVIYAGIPHGFELVEKTESTCVTNGTAEYVAKDCPCGVDYRENAYKTYSNYDSALNNKEYEPFGKDTVDLPLATEHTESDIVKGIVFTNGYANVGVISYKCLYCDETFKTDSFGPLFTCTGYSTPENGDGGIAVGFTVNQDAIAKYEEITNKTLRFGTFAVSQQKLDGKAIFDENGDAANGVICADITDYAFTSFDIKIVGFTDEYKDSKFAMGTYVITTCGEDIEYSYIQSGTPIENEKYVFTSYNEVVNAETEKEVA